jgi:DNA repair protein RecO (recombination protein O)
MNLVSEGIVLRQLHIAAGRRMIVLFTREYGKISCGTSLPESGGKNRTTLAMRPFTLGKYQIKRLNDTFWLNGAETIKSHFSLGEDVDKFLIASEMLELAGAVAPENEPAPAVYDLLLEFLDFLEARDKGYRMVDIAYQVRLLSLAGAEPELERCVSCGEAPGTIFSVEKGGVLCASCASEADRKSHLLYGARFDIIGMLRYLRVAPLAKLAKLDLEDGACEALERLLRDYYAYHLDIRNVKSASLLAEEVRRPSNERKG